MDLARGNRADDPDLADPKEAFFLDFRSIWTILKALFLPQPLTSIQEVPDAQTSQNGLTLLLTGCYSSCWEPIETEKHETESIPRKGRSMKKKVLFALPVFILFASLFLAGYARAKQAPPWARTFAPIVSTEWLKENLYRKNLVVLDIRSTGDYEVGHIPGALSEPLVNIFDSNWVGGDPAGLWLELPETEALIETIGNLGITTKSLVVIVGKPETYPTPAEYGLANATRVALTLIYAGVKKVAILDGGYPKWAEDYPELQVDTPAVPMSTDYWGEVKDGMFVSTEYVEDRIGKAVIIDARDSIVYFGNLVEPWAASEPDDLGHIESARSLPAPWIWNWNGDEIYTYKEKETLSKMASRAICGSCGYKGHGSQEIIVYCGVGGYASSWWFVLTQVLGYKNVKIYDGSAQEWAGNDFYDNEMVPDRCD